MNTKSAWISVVTVKYREYLQKMNLKEEAKLQVNRLINELHLLAIIYPSLSQAHQALIDQILQQVSRSIDEKIKGQGWMSYFSKSAEIVTLEELWKNISNFTEEPRQQLIHDITTLKNYRTSL